MRTSTKSPAETLGSVSARYSATLRPGGARDVLTAGGASRVSPTQSFPEPLSRAPVSGLPAAVDDYTEAVPFSPEHLVRDEKISRLEAVLLLAKEPLNPRKLCRFANLANDKEALTLVSRLNDLYDHSARAFRVEQVAGGWQLRTRPQFGSWLRRLQHVPREMRLSAPSMEALAVVAYRQPVLRADIEEVRGVGCGEILRQLMERDLVRVSGRSDELGRPYFYSTTQYFLQVFGLRDLDELPRADYFRRSLEEQVGINSAGESSDGDETVTVALDTGERTLSAMGEATDLPLGAVVSLPSQKKRKSKRSQRSRSNINAVDDDDDWDDEEEFDDDDDLGDEELDDEYEFDDDEVDDDDDDLDDEVDDEEELADGEE